MKILVIGLDGAGAELLLRDERLATIRSLMEAGCYGRLEGNAPSDAAPAWMSLATGQASGSPASAPEAPAPAIWDLVASRGGRSILVGVPLGSPPRPVAGITVGGSPPTDPAKGLDVQPPELAEAIRGLVAGVAEAPAEGDALAWSRTQFAVVRRLLENEPWEYVHVVATGPDRPDAAGDFYVHLDEQVAQVLEALSEDVLVLIVDLGETSAFVLAGSQLPPFGELEGVRPADLAPTLLELAGLPPLPEAAGRNFLEGKLPVEPPDGAAIDDDELVRERLRGLGYIG